MTSNSLSTNARSQNSAFLRHSCRSYWWLAVICSVVYGFAGPVFTLLKLDNITRPSMSNYQAAGTEEELLARQLAEAAQWFHAEGFILLYFSAVVLAAVIGCVMFFYLQQKRQVNFYHSQPISRTRLFFMQYLTGLLVNITPLLIMTALSCLLVAAYGLGAALSLGAVLLHLLHMLLLLFASYSIAVVSSQLAGTMLTQMALNAVLHVCVPVAAWVLNMMCNLFLATYSASRDFVIASMNFSPLCAAFVYLDNAAATAGQVMTAAPMAGSMAAVLLLLGAVLTALSWLLYQKRPSEATGKALVYPISEPLLKAYLMFVVAMAAGMLFLLTDSRSFFYFAVIVFAILTHMTCEVIIQHDFKAMGRRLPQCAVILLLILALVGVFRFDLLGYNRYLPEPDQVEQVSLVLSGVQDDNGFDTAGYSRDEAVKQAVYALLQPVIAEKQYYGSEFDNMNSRYYDYVENSGMLRVEYVLKNGRTVQRNYQQVPSSAVREGYQALYELPAYREARYSNVLNLRPEKLNSLQVDRFLVWESAWNDEDTEKTVVAAEAASAEITVDAEDAPAVHQDERRAQAEQILTAYQQDLRDRQFAALTQPQRYTITLAEWRDGQKNRIWHHDLAVYPSDRRTMALLQTLQLKKEATNDYNEALIFRSSADLSAVKAAVNTIEKQADQMLTANDYVEGLQDLAQLTGQISGVQEVGQFVAATGLRNNSGIFCQRDETHFILLRSAYEDGGWDIWQPYHDTLPGQYQ